MTIEKNPKLRTVKFIAFASVYLALYSHCKNTY